MTATLQTPAREGLARRSLLALGVAAAGLAVCRPAAAGQDFPDGVSATPWIPFDFFNDNRIFLPLKINGRETVALLDSGAGTTIIDEAWARELGLSLRQGGTAQGIGGGAQLQFADAVTIEIGGVLTLARHTLGVIDMSGVARAFGRPLPVVLGREVFNDYVVDIDFPNRRIAFHSKSGFTPPAGSARLAVRPFGLAYTVAVSVEGAPEAQAVLDLGNGAPLILSRRYADDHGVLEGRRTSTGLAGGVGGMLTQRTFTLRSVTLAGFTFHDVPSSVFDPEPEVMQVTETGNLGLPMISRFRAVADFSNGGLFLIPGPGALSEPFSRNRAGLFVVFQGDRLLVQHVAAGSPAEAGGWREGDVVRRINGQSIDAAYPGSALSRWRTGQAGSVVTLELGDGQVRTLTLSDYY